MLLPRFWFPKKCEEVECGGDKKRDDSDERDSEQDDLATVLLGLLCVSHVLGEMVLTGWTHGAPLGCFANDGLSRK